MWFRTALTWTLLLCLAAMNGLAQTTFATVTGTVTDATGALIADASVAVTSLETGQVYETKSNQSGVYTLPQLKEGSYKLRAGAAGFKEFLAQDLVLAARDIRRVNVVLEVGSVETRVEVTAGATLIETETARISDTKTASEMKNLPLNTRSMFRFLALSPNVLGRSDNSTVRFSGSGSNQSHWALDGTTMTDGNGTQISVVAEQMEGIQEVKIDMANNTAEFGTVGQVTVISKSGTNQLHGSLFDYYVSPWFRARNPFSTERSGGITHEPGGSVGGPVVLPHLYDGRNKSFFFFTMETTRGSNVTQFLDPTVPLSAWREGDFSDWKATVHDPQGNTPFAGNRIPASRINPVSQKIQNRFYPLPNYGDVTVFAAQNYREQKTRQFDSQTLWTVRGDHRFSDRDSVYGRFTRHWLFNRSYEGNLPTIGQRYQRRDNYAATVSYTHVFSPVLTNEARWGFVTNANPLIGPVSGRSVVSDLGLVGLAPDLPDYSGLLQMSWSGIGLTGLSQVNYTKPGNGAYNQEFQDHVSWFRGRHNIKLGFDITRVFQNHMAASAALYGQVGFSTRFTDGNRSGQGHPYADFLLGIPSSAARAFPPLVNEEVRWQYDFFFADDIKVNSKLTLNVGARYQVHMPWWEQSGMVSQFDIQSGSIVIPDGSMGRVSSLFPRNYVNIVEAGSVGFPSRYLVKTDLNNIAPRIGVAYRPWGSDTVFRAGYGIFYDVVPRRLTHSGIPYVVGEPTYTNPDGNPGVMFPRVFPSTGTGGPTTVGFPQATNPDLAMPYSMQYNFTIEHQRWGTGFRASFLATNTRQGDWNYNYNSPLPDDKLFINKLRPFPRYSNISYMTQGAGHQYNSLTMEAERHMARGLYFQGSWVWARDLYDLERGAAPENPFDRARERGVSYDVPQHRLTANWIYQLPVGRGKTFLNNLSRAGDLVLGGWQISGVYNAFSGLFLTPTWSGPDPTGIAYTTSSTRPTVTRRPDQLSNANLPSEQRSLKQWFNPAAFDAPDLGKFGSASKGSIVGPGVNVWHMGLLKEIPFSERAKLRVELTASNIFNHPNYSNPSLNISQIGTVGVITGVGGVNGRTVGDQPGPRRFRTGIRLEW